MSRRMTVAVCLAMGLLATPGVALADSPWSVPDAPGGWSGQAPRGDVCDDARAERGDPPCHTTTEVSPTTASAGTSTTATTTTTDVAGTSATSVTTTTDVAGTVASRAVGTSAAVVVTQAPPVGPALARTGSTPLWMGIGGLALLLSGIGLLLLNRRRRA